MHKLDWLVIGLLTFQAMVAAIVVGSPEELGLPKIVLNWLVIINVGIAVLLNQIKALGSEPRETPPQKSAGEGIGAPQDGAPQTPRGVG